MGWIFGKQLGKAFKFKKSDVSEKNMGPRGFGGYSLDGRDIKRKRGRGRGTTRGEKQK